MLQQGTSISRLLGELLKDEMIRERSDEAARARFMSWQAISLESTLIGRVFAVGDRYGFSFWNTLLVGTAQVAGAHYLCTEDLQDGQDLQGIRIVNRFVHPPGSFRDASTRPRSEGLRGSQRPRAREHAIGGF